MQIYSQPDRPAGRGRSLTQTPISLFALENGLPLIRTANLNAETLPISDLMVVIAFGQKISEPVAIHCRLGSINLHASILPKYRGAAPINWAILRGETVTGNSIIRLANRMDAGAVLGQSELQIGPTETAGELHDRLAEDGAPLVMRIIDELVKGEAIEKSQNDSAASLAPKLTRETAKIDWSQPAEMIARQIRGLSPWPGCRVRLMQAGRDVAKITLLRAISRPGPSGTSTGSIDTDGSIITNDGKVEILELQPEGKRAMTLREFKNGRPWEMGMNLESV